MGTSWVGLDYKKLLQDTKDSIDGLNKALNGVGIQITCNLEAFEELAEAWNRIELMEMFKYVAIPRVLEGV
jgi:hypothetical protein